MDKNEIVRKNREFMFPALSTYYREPLVLSSGNGSYLYDIDGNEYLDFFGGVLTVSVGHCNPEISEKIAEQVKKLQHTSTLYLNREIVSFAEKLAEIAPGKLKKSFITNSGTEANETAILTAKMYTGYNEIVTLRHSYHGRSALVMTMAGHSNWKIGGSHVPGVLYAHNAYCFRCPFKLTYPECDVQCAVDLEELIATESCGKIAAFIAEPIQGVGGFITPPKEYFKKIYDIVKKYGGIFISDEVQTGFGRTGKHWWGIGHYGVVPDMITCAKGIANGVPCGVTITTDEIADSLKGTTFSTFGGNPVSSVAALATIEYMEKKNVRENAHRVGEYLRDRLLELQEKYPFIGEVRGMGLMQALEIVKKDRSPAADKTTQILEAAKAHGLLVGRAGLYGNALRITPRLDCRKTEIETGTGILDKAFSEIIRE
ncbi:aspartate aminotransferase family protein [candidate division KSB1 bacterium]